MRIASGMVQPDSPRGTGRRASPMDMLPGGGCPVYRYASEAALRPTRHVVPTRGLTKLSRFAPVAASNLSSTKPLYKFG